MKDFISKQEGRGRFLKSNFDGSFEEFKALLNAGKLPFDLNGVNPEGVLQQGTALNKANLLSDETAARLGVEQENPTVNDALAKASEGAFFKPLPGGEHFEFQVQSFSAQSNRHPLESLYYCNGLYFRGDVVYRPTGESVSGKEKEVVFYYSCDGNSWTPAVLTASDYNYYSNSMNQPRVDCIIYFNEKYYAFSGYINCNLVKVFSSDDGLTWRFARNIPVSNAPDIVRALVFQGKLYLFYGGSCISTTDTVNWSAQISPFTSGSKICRVVTNGIVIMVKTTDAKLWYTWDAFTFTQCTYNGATFQVFDVGFGGGEFTAVCQLDGARSHLYRSTDGINWTRSEIPYAYLAYVTYLKGYWFFMPQYGGIPIVYTKNFALFQTYRATLPADIYCSSHRGCYFEVLHAQGNILAARSEYESSAVYLRADYVNLVALSDGRGEIISTPLRVTKGTYRGTGSAFMLPLPFVPKLMLVTGGVHYGGSQVFAIAIIMNQWTEKGTNENYVATGVCIPAFFSTSYPSTVLSPQGNLQLYGDRLQIGLNWSFSGEQYDYTILG